MENGESPANIQRRQKFRVALKLQTNKSGNKYQQNFWKTDKKSAEENYWWQNNYPK